jgi:L-xylulokinase
MAREGRAIERLWMVGGATRSSVWPGMVADATGLPLRVTRCAHLPAVGAAILAGLGIGAFDTLEQGQALFAQPAWELAPDAGRSEKYAHLFERYCKVLADAA